MGERDDMVAALKAEVGQRVAEVERLLSEVEKLKTEIDGLRLASEILVRRQMSVGTVESAKKDLKPLSLREAVGRVLLDAGSEMYMGAILTELRRRGKDVQPASLKSLLYSKKENRGDFECAGNAMWRIPDHPREKNQTTNTPEK